MEGGIIFGITGALYGEITLKGGRVEQSNFDHYQMLRIDEAPKIEVHIVESAEEPGQAHRRSRPPWRTRFSLRRGSACANCRLMQPH